MEREQAVHVPGWQRQQGAAVAAQQCGPGASLRWLQPRHVAAMWPHSMPMQLARLTPTHLKRVHRCAACRRVHEAVSGLQPDLSRGQAGGLQLHPALLHPGAWQQGRCPFRWRLAPSAAPSTAACPDARCCLPCVALPSMHPRFAARHANSPPPLALPPRHTQEGEAKQGLEEALATAFKQFEAEMPERVAVLGGSGGALNALLAGDGRP